MLLQTNENISDIALAYFDTKEEVLKEISEDNLYFALNPFESEYKRLYLIGDLIYKDTVKVSVISDENYTVKVKSLNYFNSVEDFDDATNEIYCILGSSYLNAIPLDILVTSNGIVDTTFFLTITIEVGV